VTTQGCLFSMTPATKRFPTMDTVTDRRDLFAPDIETEPNMGYYY